MQVAFHSVSDAAIADAPSSAVAHHDVELGLAATATAAVQGSLLERDLGAVACQLVLDTMRSHLSLNRDLREEHRRAPSEASRQALLGMLRTAFSVASREAHALARRRRVELWVSLDAVLIVESDAFIGHAGDGCVQLVRKGLIHRLTPDAPDEPLDLPGGGGARPQHSLGPSTHVVTDALHLTLSSGDRLLLSSPHLHRAVDDLRVREAGSDPLPDGVTARLVGTARANGARHDLAVTIIDLGFDPARGQAASGGRLQTLARIPLFAYCTERELLGIAGVTRPVRFRAGQRVFSEGDPGQAMYLVVVGQVAVLKESREIIRLGTGANFGEMSLLDEPQRSATVQAVDDTELLVITRDAFFSLLKRDPTLAVKVLWNMLLRISANLRATSEALAQATGRAKNPEGHNG
ncbi:cyclic nucleotide-binding domain-containing protein [Myxococcota bacterium]|jgi:serine/threonine protein phosphatase PrpC|nr:cyclic nucleotide-binding domain-containing protein [Myxococcota bacterium]